MTRDEHLEFCRRCLNRKFDPASGIICGLTGQMASFEKECRDYSIDNSVTIRVDDEESLDYKEIKAKLPGDVYEKMRAEQHLSKAVAAGFAVAFVGAILWGAFTVTFLVQFRFMGILIGAAVGFAMRKTGKGVDLIFGFFGAGIALFGCLLGNFFSIIGFIANANNLSYFQTLKLFDYSYLPEIMIDTFNIQQIFVYAVAIVSGFGLAKRILTDKDIKALRQQAP